MSFECFNSYHFERVKTINFYHRQLFISWKMLIELIWIELIWTKWVIDSCCRFACLHRSDRRFCGSNGEFYKLCAVFFVFQLTKQWFMLIMVHDFKSYKEKEASEMLRQFGKYASLQHKDTVAANEMHGGNSSIRNGRISLRKKNSWWDICY